jgi:molecular chaperone GrpE
LTAPEDVEKAAEGDAAEAAGPAAEPADELVVELAAARAQAAEYLDLAQRVQADFENFKRRVARERERAVEVAVGDTLALLLPALDHLHLALDACACGARAGDLRHGVELTLRQLEDDLGDAGVAAIPAVGETFDPQLHEAMLRVPGEPDGVVVAEFRRGYVHHGRVLRPALVSVGAPLDTGDADTAGAAGDAGGTGDAGTAGTEGGSEA